MTIVNIFDAAREGDWDAFQKFYNGNINEVDPYSNFNLLQLAVTSTENSEGRLAIIRFLLENGVDLNFRDKNIVEMHSIFPFLDENITRIFIFLNPPKLRFNYIIP